MSPTMYPPTMKPTQTNAPYAPIKSPILGWVTNNRYVDGSCDSFPVIVAGYQTNTCIGSSSSNSATRSVQYTCDSGKRDAYSRFVSML